MESVNKNGALVMPRGGYDNAGAAIRLLCEGGPTLLSRQLNTYVNDNMSTCGILSYTGAVTGLKNCH